MKMKPEHFAHLKAAINKAIEGHGGLSVVVRRYETGDFPRSDKTKDLNMRFRWDLLHVSNLYSWMHDTLYKYLDDKHIDTALKSIVPTIERRY